MCPGQRKMDNLNKAMSATPVLARLKRQRESLTALGVEDHHVIDAQIVELKKIVALGPPAKKDPYLEYGEAEVEMILS